MTQILCAIFCMILIAVSVTSAETVEGFVSNSADCVSDNAQLNSVTNPFCSLGQLYQMIEPLTFVDVTITLTGDPSRAFVIDMNMPFAMYYNSFSLRGDCGSACVIKCNNSEVVQALYFDNMNYTLSMTDITLSDCYYPGIYINASAILPAAPTISLTRVTVQDISAYPLTITANWATLILTDVVYRRNNVEAGLIQCQHIYIRNSTIETNAATGATAPFFLNIVTSNWTVSIINSTFKDNIVSAAGAGIQIVASGSNGMVEILQSHFMRNVVDPSSGSGGAMSIKVTNYTAIKIESSTFDSNKGSSGGALCIQSTSATDHDIDVNVTNCIFTNNLAIIGGAILYIVPYYTVLPPTVLIHSTVFQGNIGDGGAALGLGFCILTLTQSSFTQNIANQSVISVQNNATGTIRDSLISYNNVINSSLASAITLDGAQITITGTTISSNYGNASGILVNNAMLISVTDSYIWNNAGYAIRCLFNSTIDLATRTSIYRNAWAIGGPDTICGAGCTLLFPQGQDGCTPCSHSLRDICGVCGGSSVCISNVSTSSCQVPYSPCAAPTLTNPQSEVSVQYAGINPILQTNTSTALAMLDFYSLTDMGTKITYALKDVAFLQSSVLISQGATLVSFEGNLATGASVVVQQTLYGNAQDVNYAGTTFTVNDDTLKTTLRIANWPTDNTVRLTLNVDALGARVNSLVTQNRGSSIIEDTLIITHNTTTKLSLANVFVSQGSLVVGALVSYKLINNRRTVQVNIDFPGPIGALEYDPDIGVLIGGSGDGGDGDDSAILIEVLVPVLLGGAGICICTVIILAVLLATAARVLQRQRRSRALSQAQSDAL